MWAITGIVVLSGVCAAVDMPMMKGRAKELWVFWLLLLLGAGLSIAVALRLPIPNPLDMIAVVFRPVGYWLHNILLPAN
ncbi:hypothetical protein [Paenibacillus silvisoli]|uniref:hypothetical protein n=1 Tax=Paenibacillus silvisoli TaxID=3110539 RepID=UPI00280624F3|nr:hypothetical protein [Paenibacillus silvisoli]